MAEKILVGKTALVTGSTDGIGRETALRLAELGAKVIVHGRSAARAIDAAKWIAGQLDVEEPAHVVADLSAISNVHRLAESVRELAAGKLDILVNNAGVYMSERRLSFDGFEMTFAVNHLAPFLLTNLLLPELGRANSARVATVASVAHTRGSIDWDDIQAEKSFDGYAAYARSKLCNVLFAFELAHRLNGSSIASNALHPGVITTKLLMQGFGSTGASVGEGAKTSVYVASSPDIEGVSGEYFSDEKKTRASEAARARINQTKLWEYSAELCGLA